MKLLIRLVFTTVLLLTLLAWEKPQNNIKVIRRSWEVAEKNVPIGNIKQVNLYTLGELYIEAGKSPELRIEADDNLLPYLTAKEKDGKLEIMADKGVKIGNDLIITPPTNDTEEYHFSRIVNVHFIPRRRIKYYLKVNNLEGISSWNFSNVTATSLEGEKFIIRSGSSRFSMGKLTAKEVTINPGGKYPWNDTRMRDMKIEALYAEKLHVHINSNQNVNIDGGEVHRQEIIIRHQGNYNARKVNCVEADVQVNAEGSVTVSVSKRLNVHLSDYSGNVYYMGEPEVIENRESEASGKLIKITE